MFTTHLCDHHKAKKETSNRNDQKKQFTVAVVSKGGRKQVRDSCN